MSENKSIPKTDTNNIKTKLDIMIDDANTVFPYIIGAKSKHQEILEFLFSNNDYLLTASQINFIIDYCRPPLPQSGEMCFPLLNQMIKSAEHINNFNLICKVYIKGIYLYEKHEFNEKKIELLKSGIKFFLLHNAYQNAGELYLKLAESYCISFEERMTYCKEAIKYLSNNSEQHKHATNVMGGIIIKSNLKILPKETAYEIRANFIDLYVDKSCCHYVKHIEPLKVDDVWDELDLEHSDGYLHACLKKEIRYTFKVSEALKYLEKLGDKKLFVMFDIRAKEVSEDDSAITPIPYTKYFSSDVVLEISAESLCEIIMHDMKCSDPRNIYFGKDMYIFAQSLKWHIALTHYDLPDGEAICYSNFDLFNAVKPANE